MLKWHTYREWIVHYGGGLYDRIDRHHVFLMASGLAFSLLMCIVPLVLIIFAILGMVLGKPSIIQEIDTLIERLVPYESYASFVKQLVLSRVGEFTIYKNAAGIIGLVGLLFAATSLFSGMRTTLNTVYRVPSSESVLIGKLKDLGLVVLVLLYFLLSTTLLPSLEITKELADRVGSGLGAVGRRAVGVGQATVRILYHAFRYPQIGVWCLRAADRGGFLDILHFPGVYSRGRDWAVVPGTARKASPRIGLRYLTAAASPTSLNTYSYLVTFTR
jgi:uncharacterized BrkB/YihY/UPF0761 family membrane protein